jgi:dephospho-CoA kinase
MSNENKPLIIGLTGGMGSGKSTVARIFNEKYGIPVYEADAEAKKLMHRKQIKEKIIKAFGPESFVEGKLNTKYLANKVFGNKKQLKQLESIVHPEVKKDFIRWADKQKNVPFVILENAILFESGMDKLCDYILYVQTALNRRIKRIKNRDRLPEKDIEKRLSHQLEDNILIKKSDFVLNNDDSINHLMKNVEKLYTEIINMTNTY